SVEVCELLEPDIEKIPKYAINAILKQINSETHRLEVSRIWTDKQSINSEKIKDVKQQTTLIKELIKLVNDFAYPQLLSEPYSRPSSFGAGVAKNLIEYFKQNELELTAEDCLEHIQEIIHDIETDEVKKATSYNLSALFPKLEKVILESNKLPNSDFKSEQPVAEEMNRPASEYKMQS
ncbi:MAG: hypothetical protein ACK4PR_11175, partial [Gammaproteobacteria bacterium]